jgi:hypothetical protein
VGAFGAGDWLNFFSQRIGHGHSWQAQQTIFVVQAANPLQMRLQRAGQSCWLHGQPVLATFSLANHDFPPVKIQVLDP